MGTSVNQRSPKTPNWQAVGVVYSNPDIPVDRAVEEIWRASSNEATGGIVDSLSAPVVAGCVGIVENAKSSLEAVQRIRQLITSTGKATLAVDIAQRAAILSFGKAENRQDVFVQALFSEASNYLVSRDIPGYVGSEKLRTVKELIAFKTSVLQSVASSVATVSLPKRNLADPKTWRRVVNQIVDRLTGES